MGSIFIQAFSLSSSQDSIRKYLPAAVLDKIKASGSNPYFQMYSILHEGTSRPRVINEGFKTIEWSRQAVNTAKALVTKGLQFFVGHNKDSSTKGRQALGKVVASFQKDIKGLLHQVVIGHFPNKEEAKKYDICSIEAQADFVESGDISVAQRIARITGIALGSSSNDSPAFPGARRLASLQAFAAVNEEEKNKKSEGDSTMITFDEIKKGIKDLNIFPHQAFSMEDIERDNVFGKLVSDNKANMALSESLTKQLEEKSTELATSQKEAALSTIKESFDKLIPVGSTDKQKAFYKSKFKPELMEDLSETGLKSFFEGAATEYQTVAGIFGDKETGEKEGGTGSDSVKLSEDLSDDEEIDSLLEESMDGE